MNQVDTSRGEVRINGIPVRQMDEDEAKIKSWHGTSSGKKKTGARKQKDTLDFKSNLNQEL